MNKHLKDDECFDTKNSTNNQMRSHLGSIEGNV